MAEQVKAIYEKGILRPLQPLDLQENQLVRIRILPEDEAAKQMGAAIRALVAAGLLTPPPGQSAEAPLSEEERRALADRMGQSPGKPLSETIIEDRGSR